MKNNYLINKIKDYHEEQKVTLSEIVKEISKKSDIHSILRAKNSIEKFVDLQDKKNLLIEILTNEL